MNYSEKIIELSKRTKQLTIVPFGQSFLWCNNNCSFCYLKDYLQKKPLSIERVRKITSRIDEWIIQYKDMLDADTKIKVNLIGGELFSLGKEYYDEYRYLLDVVSKHFKQIDVSLFSNLIYNNIDMLISLSKDYNTSIVTSFDVNGRFKSENDAKLWWSNLNILKDSNIELDVELTLSKEMINRYVYQKDYYTMMLDRILNDSYWTVNADILIPNSDDNYSNIPTQNDLILFYKTIYDRHRDANIDLLKYEDIDDNEEYDIFSDCARLQFNENGIIELYCDDVHRMITKQHVNQNILKDEDIKSDFICVVKEKKIKYYFDNVYGCSSCNVRGYCKKKKLRECYRTRNYAIWEDKCWIKPILKYVKKNG